VKRRRVKMLKNLVLILMAGVLVNNYVLQKFLGICPFLGVSKKFNQALGMGGAVIFVMLCATAATWPIQTYILDKFGLGYLQTIVFILVIAALVQFVEIVLKRFIPALYKSLGVYLPLITTNCAVLGVTINNITDGYNFLESMVSSLGVGLGFLLAMVLFAGVRSRIENCPAPKCFKGLPVTLVAASIVSLAFYGFAGIVENMIK
jgi:electron transport complex protein RnfA